MSQNPEGKVAYSVELQIADDAVFLKGGKQRFDFTLKMTNGGRRAMEDLLDIEYPQINARINAGQVGSRMTTALLFGATRKFHARKMPTVAACDEFMDALYEKADDDEDEDLLLDLQLALLAANARTTVGEMRRRLRLDEDDDESADDEDEAEGDPKDEKKPTRGRAASGRGKNS